MNKKLLVGSCGLAAVAGNMFADENVSYFNPYASLKGGYAFLSKKDGFKYKGGFAGAVELGVSYDAWRMGLELGYKSNKIKECDGPGKDGKWFFLGSVKQDAPIAGADVAHASEHSMYRVDGATWFIRNAMRLSKINALTGMVNVFYDYAMTEAWSCYAGVGFGVAKVSIVCDRYLDGTARNTGDNTASAHGAATAATWTAVNTVLNADANSKDVKNEFAKTVFAWQVMAGVGYEFNENWKLTLGYKLFNTSKMRLFGLSVKSPFNHTVEAGLNYTF